MVTYTTQEAISFGLTPEGTQIAENGSHEAIVWAALPLKGQGTPLTVRELKEKVGEESAKIGQGRAFKNGWAGKEGDGLVKLVSILGHVVPPMVLKLLTRFRNMSPSGRHHQ